MAAKRFLQQRLNQQRLARDPLETPEAVVAWLGAVQAQEYPEAKWSLAMRLTGATDAQMEQSFNEGRILRTHVMRPTWHFVTPEDICWMQALTAPRVHAANGYWNRQHELDDDLLERGSEVLARALEGGRFLTKAELGQVLSEAGIHATGNRLGYIVHYAELKALVCSGPRRGKQHTYALIAERAPHSRELPREEALAELARRYFTSHGPATVRDFSWWSGLTLTECKTAVQMLAAELEQVEADGETYWFAAAHPPSDEPVEQAYLLPTFDEFLVGYAGYDKARQGGNQPAGSMAFYAPLLHSGTVIGSWRRTLKKNEALVELAPFTPLDSTQQSLLEEAMRRFADFLELPVKLEERAPG